MMTSQETRLIELFKQDVVDNNLFNVVYKMKKVNVDDFLVFLDSKNEMVKSCVIKLIGRHRTDLLPLVEVLNKKNSYYIMEGLVRALGDKNQYIEQMSKLLDEDSALLNLIIDYLVKTNNREQLTILLFSENSQLAEYVKKKVEENDDEQDR